VRSGDRAARFDHPIRIPEEERHLMDRIRFAKLVAGLAGATLAVSNVTGVLAQDASTTPDASAPAGGAYTIAMTNTLVGNGWREEMRCSILAQAAASGQVADVEEFHQNSDAAGQAESIRNFIAAGVDAILVNPADAAALDEAIKEATDAGIVVVSMDQAVTAPTAYSITNDHAEYARLGAEWLFNHLGGAGDVYYMRGIAGAPADDDRDAGFQAALANFPDINVVQEDATGWDFPTGKRLMLEFLASGLPVNGVWTSGIDFVIPEAFVESEVPFVPVVGADSAEFVSQLAGPEALEGLQGAFVTNPASIGGAAVTLALQALNGDIPKVPESAETAVAHITPVLYENVTEEGRAAVEAALDPDLPGTWPVGITVPDWTTYTKEDLLACGGTPIGES
jgi:ribose transport system substrate-binding protein